MLNFMSESDEGRHFLGNMLREESIVLIESSFLKLMKKFFHIFKLQALKGEIPFEFKQWKDIFCFY